MTTLKTAVQQTTHCLDEINFSFKYETFYWYHANAGNDSLCNEFRPLTDWFGDHMHKDIFIIR